MDYLVIYTYLIHIINIYIQLLSKSNTLNSSYLHPSFNSMYSGYTTCPRTQTTKKQLTAAQLQHKLMLFSNILL